MPGAEFNRPPRMLRWDLLGLSAATLLVGAPALLSHGGFSFDFRNHLWLVWQQSQTIQATSAPSLFLHATGVGAFYPFYAFYGGTLYTVTGAVATLLGGRVLLAYVGSILIGIAAAYGGVLWIARQLGARTVMAHAPAIAYVASAYYVTNLYGRGAWPEFIATSVLPLTLAATLRLLQAPRVEGRTVAAFLAAAVIFTGAHNITLLLGALAGVGAIAVISLGHGRSTAVDRRRPALVGGLFVLAVGINAWFLLPDLLYANRTMVGAATVQTWQKTRAFNTPGVIFDPLRQVPRSSNTSTLYVQAPDWMLAWAMAALVLGWTAASRRLRRAAAGLIALLVLVLLALLVPEAYNALPRLIREMQFPYRLNTYLALGTAGLVTWGVLSVERRPGSQVLPWLLGAVTAVTVVLCGWQLATTSSKYTSSADEVFRFPHAIPPTFYHPTDFADRQGTPVPTVGPPVPLSLTSAAGDRTTVSITPPGGVAPFATDIMAGRYLLSVQSRGLAVLGRAVSGGLALRRIPPRTTGPVRVTVGLGGAARVGRWISLASIAIAIVLLVRAVGLRPGSGRRRPALR